MVFEKAVRDSYIKRKGILLNNKNRCLGHAGRKHNPIDALRELNYVAKEIIN